jgi:DNA polymerase III subunit epsilon
MGLDGMPASVAFCDVETTGLTRDDRIVSFAAIGLITSALAKRRFDLAYTYLVFDPGKRSHREAEQVHGFSDWVLRFQDPFSVYAEELWRFLTSYELLVAHNAAFDFRFINREMTLARLPALPKHIYCTMKGYRALGIGGSASLNVVCRHIKLARGGELHGALEDAWLAMQVYLWLHGCPVQGRLPASLPRTPTNLRTAPPMRGEDQGSAQQRRARGFKLLRGDYGAAAAVPPVGKAETASRRVCGICRAERI